MHQRQLLKYFLLLVLLVGFSAATDNSASACECEDLKKRTPYLLDSDSIFLGKVKSVEKTNDEFASYFVKFDVDKVWTGSNTKEIVIRASLDSGICGYPFEVNQSLVVHASKENDILNEKGCGTLPVEYVTDYIRLLDENVQNIREDYVKFNFEKEKPAWNSFQIIGKYKNTNPPKPDQTFVVPYRIINGTLESIRGDDVEIVAVVNTTGMGLLELKFPRNFPYSNGPGDYPDNFFIGINGYGSDAYYLPETTPMMDHVREKIINKINRPPPHPQTYSEKTDCYFLFSIPFYTYAKIGIHYGANGLIPDPYQGEIVPEQCIKQTILPDKSISPLQQFKSGIPIDKIQCKEGLELILKSHDGSPACVKPETKQKLIQRGWAVNDLPTKTESEGIQTAFETWTTQGMVLVNIDKLTNTVDSIRLVDSTPDINATQVEENQKKIIQAALSNIQVQKLTKEKDYFIFQVRHNHVYCDNCMCPEEGCTLVGFSTTENQKFGVGMTVILNPTTGQVFDIRTSQAWNQTQNKN